MPPKLLAVRAFLLTASAVLAAIALGVVAESRAPATLGPARAPFTASFPGTPHALRRMNRVPTPISSGAASRAPILLYLRGPTPARGVGDFSYLGAADGRSLMVSLVIAPAFVPDPASVGTTPLDPVRSEIAQRGGTPRPSRAPLVMHPATLDGKKVLIGVACIRRRQHASACIGVLSGLETATTHDITTWTASATAPTATAVRTMLRSLRPLSP